MNTNFNDDWTHQKNLFAQQERKQEAQAFLSDPDFTRNPTEEQLLAANKQLLMEDHPMISKDHPPEAALSSVDSSKNFILAGNAVFTIRSITSGKRFTFKVQKPKEQNHNPKFGPYDPNKWFVKYLYGQANTTDYRYLGMLKRIIEDSEFTPGKQSISWSFGTTKASQTLTNSPMHKAFQFVFNNLFIHNCMPPDCEVWHSGHCGRCNKLLTVPSSIANGIGPECIKKM